MDKKQILYELRATNNAVGAYANRHNNQSREIQVTSMLHGRIIKHLYNNDSKDVFQRDIEALLSVRRSTATSILQCMEKNGLITRVSVSSDARLKKLCLTDKARSLHEQVSREIEQTEELVRTGITEIEMETFFRVLDKIRNNLKTE